MPEQLEEKMINRKFFRSLGLWLVLLAGVSCGSDPPRDEMKVNTPADSSDSLPTLPAEGSVSPPQGFEALFDGNSLEGWKWHEGLEGRWEVADGVIRLLGEQPPRERGKDDHLWTEESFANFILIADWRLTGEPVLQQMNDFTKDGLIKVDSEGNRIRHAVEHAGDSGIFVRGYPAAQVNIWSQPMGSGDINPIHKDSDLSEEIRRAAMPKVAADHPPGKWNRFVITVEGDQISVILNGETVIDQAPIPGMPEEGPIALQNHSDPIEFRNIFIRRLN